MSRNMGLTQRQRLHLNLLQQADYRQLRMQPRGIAWGLFLGTALWTFIAFGIWAVVS